jgi:hypothetical protein
MELDIGMGAVCANMHGIRTDSIETSWKTQINYFEASDSHIGGVNDHLGGWHFGDMKRIINQKADMMKIQRGASGMDC